MTWGGFETGLIDPDVIGPYSTDGGTITVEDTDAGQFEGCGTDGIGRYTYTAAEGTLRFQLVSDMCGARDFFFADQNTKVWMRNPSVLSTIEVSATSITFSAAGETEQLTATVLDQNGAERTGEAVSWSSSAFSVASVSSAGLVTAVATGSATITATSGAASETVSVVVD